MPKTCYLTVDEFPSKDSMNKIRFLKAKGVPAILFCRGDMLEKRPHHGVYAVKNGFVLGNHSYDHPDFNQLSLDKAKDQIEDTDQIIDEIYRRAGIERKTRYFRFPYFNRGGTEEKVEKLQEFLESLDYEKPRFKNISYDWYRDTGHQNFIDVSFTYSVDDYKVFEDGNGIDSLEDVLAKMDREQPENGCGLNFQESNDIVAMHDHPFTDRELSMKIFKRAVEKMVSKNLEFRLPEPHKHFHRRPPTLKDFFENK